MILTIDIGNSNIVLGCIDQNATYFVERLSTNHTKTDLEYAFNIKSALDLYHITPDAIEGSIISSVVPPLSNVLKKAVHKCLGIHPLLVGPGLKTGLNIKIDNPAQLGSDLVVDAVAAIAEYPLPAIVIDMGTATTFSVIDRNKNYLGGGIIPGVRVALDALISHTSQLSKISLEAPRHTIGKNTIECIKSGAIYANASMLDGMITRIEEEVGESCTVIATGGLSSFIVPYCRQKIIYDDELLLKGLLLIYQKNKPTN